MPASIQSDVVQLDDVNLLDKVRGGNNGPKKSEAELMADKISDIPEVRGLDARRGLIRIPPETDVPLTTRVSNLIDTRPFRRLSRISQLGLVSLVYPAAHHSRFEHSLGVYRTALLYLQQLAQDDRFTRVVSARGR